MSIFYEVLRVEAAGGRAVVLTVVSGDDIGAKLFVDEDGNTVGDAHELAPLAADAIRVGRSHMVDDRVFADVIAPPSRLFVYGAVDTAEALCKAAKLIGWSSVVAEASTLEPCSRTAARSSSLGRPKWKLTTRGLNSASSTAASMPNGVRTGAGVTASSSSPSSA